jgi:hypothetical protein
LKPQTTLNLEPHSAKPFVNKQLTYLSQQDTGVGKSMMLNLYSQFVNADSAISIDWHTQFLVLVKGLAIVCVDDPFVRERFFASVGGNDTQYLGQLYESERQQELSQAAKAADAQPLLPQFTPELRAAAAARLKIADYRRTPGLIHVSDKHGINSERFATCKAAVAAILDVGSEDDKNRCSEKTLELFGDALCFYFCRLVDSVPLIKRGLSPFCSVLFERTKKILQDGGARRRNAQRVCKVATCLYDSKPDSCGNRAFGLRWSGLDDLSVEDFIIEEVAEEQDELPHDLFALADELAPVAEAEPDAVPSGGGGGDAGALDFDIRGRPPIFKKNTDFRDFMESLVQTRPFGLYHRILAHDGLDCVEWRSRINAIKNDAAEAVKAFPNAVICVFVDEMNTANALGLISEAFSNHSMDGESLPTSLFFVGAINPLIKDSAPVHQEHLGINDDDEYAMREFIVRPLPPSLIQMEHEWVKFSSEMEKNFLEEYIKKRHLPVFLTKVLNWEELVREGPLDCTLELNRAYERDFGAYGGGNAWLEIAHEFHKVAVELIVKCQKIINEYSSRKLLLRVRPSIRDILRCVNMWHWILLQQIPSECDAQLRPKKDSYVNPYLPEDPYCIDTRPGLSFECILPFVRKRLRQALYAAVAICYYIRLPSSVKDPVNTGRNIQLRRDFLEKLQRELVSDRDANPINFVQNWRECVDHLWKYAQIPPGIAHTDVLKENFFAIVVALHVKPTMPLLITGPAGVCLL